MTEFASPAAPPATDARPPRRPRNEVNGWIVLDKPVGLTSTQAVSRLKRIFSAKKAGHAGTLDPLASGLLPVAFGEATKTVPFVQYGVKRYRFRIRWGARTDSDDSEGRVVATSGLRPSRDALEARLPGFIGTHLQRPPAFSAIKVAGERAYDRARDGEVFELEARPVTIHALWLIDATPDEATLEAECGKGTYVRAIARDLGEALGCYGHVNALRRTRVGPFDEASAIGFGASEEDEAAMRGRLLGIEAGLGEVANVPVARNEAARLRRGQALLLRGRDAPLDGMAYASCGGVVVAFGPVEAGALHPYRVFNGPI